MDFNAPDGGLPAYTSGRSSLLNSLASIQNQIYMGSAGADVGWEPLSGARTSKSEVKYLGEPGVVADQKGSLGDHQLHEQCWRFAEEEDGHRSHSGGRRRKTAHDQPLEELLQCEAGRKKQNQG